MAFDLGGTSTVTMFLVVVVVVVVKTDYYSDQNSMACTFVLIKIRDTSN